MAGDRSRGRPARSAGDVVARERLLASTRDRMRELPPIKLHRRSIAEAAGVAPALVTYYFRNEPALIEAAARPIIEGYLERLKVAVSHDDGLSANLRRLVDLLLEIGRTDGQLLDTYIRFMKEQNVEHKRDILSGSYSIIDTLIRSGQDSGDLRQVNTAFMATALWGICKTVSQMPELAKFLQGGDDEVEGHTIMGELILDLLLRSLKPDNGSSGGTI